MKLSDITIPVVTQFKKGMREKGASPAMIRKVVVSLGSIIADAQEQGLAAHNAVRELRRSKKRGERKSRSEKRKLQVGKDIPTPAEVSAIIAHAPTRWRSLLVVAAFCGLRASELRGLRWEDVDLKRQELHVRQRADRFNEIGAPKSEAGERTVPFGPVVANTLRPGYMQAGGRGFAFPTSKGTIVEHSNLVKASIIPAARAAGLPHYTGLHCLRHFYASWCINRVEDGGAWSPRQERAGAHGP
jgi:integrase